MSYESTRAPPGLNPNPFDLEPRALPWQRAVEKGHDDAKGPARRARRCLWVRASAVRGHAPRTLRPGSADMTKESFEVRNQAPDMQDIGEKLAEISEAEQELDEEVVERAALDRLVLREAGEKPESEKGQGQFDAAAARGCALGERPEWLASTSKLEVGRHVKQLINHRV